MTKYAWLKLAAVAVILGILIAICVVEDNIVKTSLARVDNFCTEIENAVIKNDGIVNGEVASLVENLEYSWEKDESSLCFMANHKSIENLGVEIVRLKTYIDEEEPIEFYVSLNIIKNYVESYHHFMGANFHNIL